MNVSHNRTSGVALVVTLLVIVVLTIAVTAFMQSMSLERRTSQAYLNILKANEAVEAGFADGTRLVTNFKLTYPYHAVAYKSLSSPAQITPYMIGNADYNTNPTTNEIRLVSGNPALATTLDNTNSIEMNIKSDSGDQLGWMGSPIVAGAPSYRSQRAMWIKLLRDNSQPEQPNPSTANFNPVVARYAFWVDDETCKLDIGVNGNSDGATGKFSRSNTGASVSDLDISALPMKARAPLPDDATGGMVLKNITDFRSKLPFALGDSRVLNRMSPTELTGTPAEDVKFSATTFSKSDELSGTGRRRVNLNYLVTNNANPDAIAADLDDIGWVITGKHILKSASPYTALTNAANSGMFLDQADTTGPLSTFGNRFYIGATTAHSDLYLKKLAANIRDYIDADNQPTVIDNTAVIPANSKPTTGPSIAQSNYQVIGKEAIPYLQEHAWRGYIESWNDNGTTSATGTLRIDHYFEFFNPTTKNFTATPGTFLKVYDFPSWLAGTFPNLTPPDFEVDLNGIVFPAGKTVVVTTNTTGIDTPGLIQSGAQLEARPANPATAVRFVNITSDGSISTVKGFQFQGRSSSITDYKTRFLWGNNSGIYDSFPALAISLSNTAPWNFTSRNSNVNSQTRFVYSSSMRGNDDVSRSGDPRSLSEQISYLDYSSGGSSDQTRFYGNIQGHSDAGGPSIPGNSSLGKAAISFVNPNNWKDYAPALADSNATAFAVVADAPMTSIGELGNIYDPARIVGTGSLVSYARGGGRTLKLGQIDDLIPPTRFTSAGATTTWFNAAWRLTDLFCAEPATRQVSLSSKPGKLNINGVLRDDGTAMRAALRSFTFLPSPNSDPTRNGQTLSATEIDSLITAIKNYLTNNGPFMERGELSQLPFFTGSGATGTAGTSPGSTTNDRGREEIFRRMVELITVRSNSFSVYVVGEAVLQSPSGTLRTLSRQARKFNMQMNPLKAGSSLDSANLSDKVDGYKITKVYDVAR